MEQIEEIIKERSIEVTNRGEKNQPLTSNKTITQYTSDYIKKKKLHNEIFNQINQVRLFKRVVILAKLIRARDLNTMECYNKIEIKSLLE